MILGAILVAGMILAFLRNKPLVEIPSAYFLFLALIAMMAVSLTYTPNFDAGLDKLLRFLTLTGVVIVAPFFVLGSPKAMKRFLIAFGSLAFVICCYSLTSLGGSDRLVTPSDNTIGLGHIACALILLIWLAVLPRYRYPLRLFVYPLLAVPMIGSGRVGGAWLGNRVCGCDFDEPSYSAAGSCWIWSLSPLSEPPRFPSCTFPKRRLNISARSSAMEAWPIC